MPRCRCMDGCRAPLLALRRRLPARCAACQASLLRLRSSPRGCCSAGGLRTVGLRLRCGGPPGCCCDAAGDGGHATPWLVLRNSGPRGARCGAPCQATLWLWLRDGGSRRLGGVCGSAAPCAPSLGPSPLPTLASDPATEPLLTRSRLASLPESTDHSLLLLSTVLLDSALSNWLPLLPLLVARPRRLRRRRTALGVGV